MLEEMRSVNANQRASESEVEYFSSMFKFARRVASVVALTMLSFRAVGSFLSWVEKQEDEPQSVWTDEDEFEDA